MSEKNVYSKIHIIKKCAFVGILNCKLNWSPKMLENFLLLEKF